MIRNHWKSIALIATAIILVAIGAAIAATSLSFSNTVTITSGAIVTATYKMSDETESHTLGQSVSWGSMNQNSTKSMTVTLTNSGAVSSTLNIALPAPTGGCTLTAPSTPIIVPAHGAVDVIVTLTVADSAPLTPSPINIGTISIAGT